MPVGTPVEFRITSDSVLNAFFIPQLGSMIYAMAGMRTQLHLIADQEGVYPGQSAMYSGRGFSDMKFDTIAVPDAKFAAWLANARRSPATLTADDYQKYAAPEEKAPVQYFSAVQPHLFDDIIAKYMGKADSFRSAMPASKE